MKKCSCTYLLAVLVLVVAFGLLTTTHVYAENKLVTFFKNVVKWPFSIAKKNVETVGRTTEKAATTVTKTTGSVVETVTGKPEKIKDVVVEPVKGSVDTAYTAVEGSVKAPIEGTKEAFEPKAQE